MNTIDGKRVAYVAATRAETEPTPPVSTCLCADYESGHYNPACPDFVPYETPPPGACTCLKDACASCGPKLRADNVASVVMKRKDSPGKEWLLIVETAKTLPPSAVRAVDDWRKAVEAGETPSLVIGEGTVLRWLELPATDGFHVELHAKKS